MAALTSSSVDVTAHVFSPLKLEENCLVNMPMHCTRVETENVKFSSQKVFAKVR